MFTLSRFDRPVFTAVYTFVLFLACAAACVVGTHVVRSEIYADFKLEPSIDILWEPATLLALVWAAIDVRGVWVRLLENELEGLLLLIGMFIIVVPRVLMWWILGFCIYASIDAGVWDDYYGTRRDTFWSLCMCSVALRALMGGVWKMWELLILTVYPAADVPNEPAILSIADIQIRIGGR